MKTSLSFQGLPGSSRRASINSYPSSATMRSGRPAHANRRIAERVCVVNTVSGYDRPVASVRGNRLLAVAAGQKHPQCCGLAHRLRAEGAFCLSKQKHDAQFAQLIEQSQERVYRLALRITRNTEDAEDVQQETMLKVHRKLGQFEGRSRLTTWISRIAINEALMCLRKRRSAAHMALEEAMLSAEEILARDGFQSAVEGPEAAYSRKELRDLLTRAIAYLRPAYRVVFLLRAIEQLSTIETAKVLQLSSGVVKNRLRRARSELQEYLRNGCPAATHEHPNGMAKPDSDRQPVPEGWRCDRPLGETELRSPA